MLGLEVQQLMLDTLAWRKLLLLPTFRPRTTDDDDDDDDDDHNDHDHDETTINESNCGCYTPRCYYQCAHGFQE